MLKPKFLRTSDSTFKTNGPFPADDSRTLEVRIISGFVLPKKSSDSTSSILDPYVQVSKWRSYERNVKIEIGTFLTADNHFLK